MQASKDLGQLLILLGQVLDYLLVFAAIIGRFRSNRDLLRSELEVFQFVDAILPHLGVAFPVDRGGGLRPLQVKQVGMHVLNGFRFVVGEAQLVFFGLHDLKQVRILFIRVILEVQIIVFERGLRLLRLAH